MCGPGNVKFLLGIVSHGPETKYYISRATLLKFGLFYQEFADIRQIFGIGQKKSKWKINLVKSTFSVVGEHCIYYFC